MRLAMLIACLVSLALTAGCGNKYLVKGLRLPPGSTEVEFLKAEGTGGTASVTSHFNYTGGWDGLAAYIDRCMAAEGYAEAMDEISAGGIPGMSGMLDIPGMEEIAKASRMYAKEDGEYFVTLTNNRAIMEAFTGGMGSMDMPGSHDEKYGDYTLLVERVSD